MVYVGIYLGYSGPMDTQLFYLILQLRGSTTKFKTNIRWSWQSKGNQPPQEIAGLKGLLTIGFPLIRPY